MLKQLHYRSLLFPVEYTIPALGINRCLSGGGFDCWDRITGAIWFSFLVPFVHTFFDFQTLAEWLGSTAFNSYSICPSMDQHCATECL